VETGETEKARRRDEKRRIRNAKSREYKRMRREASASKMTKLPETPMVASASDEDSRTAMTQQSSVQMNDDALRVNADVEENEEHDENEHYAQDEEIDNEEELEVPATPTPKSKWNSFRL
jgi:hypothetical protein